MDDPIGQLGNYRILSLLGQGSFADVYLGEHVHLHTQAAIKVLRVRLVESNIQSFLNEARTIAHLVHPYIIRVLDFGVEANTPFLVMDYAPKGTFRQRFLHAKPLPPTPLFPYIKQAASALQYAHDKKLVHRDVKPENMLLGPNEETLLSDFGFAVIQTSISRPSPETAGTASYMAPEQFQGKAQPASDQYSLAIVAYEWLAGVCPFQGTFMELASQHMVAQPPSLLQCVPGLSAQVAQVVMTALAKEPEQRFPSVRDFARALEHACLASPTNLTSSSPSVSSPSLVTNPGLNASLAGTSWAGTNRMVIGPAPTTGDYNPQLSPHAAHQPPDAFQTRLQPPQHSRSGQSSFPLASTTAPPPSGHAIERFSQSGLPPLQPQHIAQSLSEFTNSPLKSPEQLFPSVSSPSLSHSPLISELPPLPQQPFLAPELTTQNSRASMTSQTFPVQQNVGLRTPSLSQSSSPLKGVSPLNIDASSRSDSTVSNEQSPAFLASGQRSTPAPKPLVRPQDFRVRPRSSTSQPLYLFAICMVVLIIASTAILVTLTNYLHHGPGSISAPHTDATATTASQQHAQTPAVTPPPQAEQNPYGNHNGILVLNDPLSQQNQEKSWEDSPGFCSFSAGSYHVVAGPQAQNFTLCNATASDYANFVYQVQMTLTKATSTGDSGGLVFRGNIPNSQFYFLEIFTTGNYALYRCPGSKGTCVALSSSTITGGGPIPSFHTGLNQPNTIAIIASGNTFTIYVNNQLIVDRVVDTVTDPPYSHGSVGMMAREKNTNAITDVSFNNVKIWKL
jgi:serine/threonine protein kinase